MNTRILIVDDDWICLQLLKRRLEKKGYEVLTARNEKEFWDQAFDPYADFALILVNICLNNRLGTDVYQCLLHFGMNEKIPVIFTTGLAEGNENWQILRDDDYSFVPKTVDLENLEEEIERMLQTNTLKNVA
ncbi:MAG: response regulator [Candidatus Omnitrophica bacterium]|nr:response regulator [Candidatus Omnitrophota bacterium]